MKMLLFSLARHHCTAVRCSSTRNWRCLPGRGRSSSLLLVLHWASSSISVAVPLLVLSASSVEYSDSLSSEASSSLVLDRALVSEALLPVGRESTLVTKAADDRLRRSTFEMRALSRATEPVSPTRNSCSSSFDAGCTWEPVMRCSSSRTASTSMSSMCDSRRPVPFIMRQRSSSARTRPRALSSSEVRWSQRSSTRAMTSAGSRRGGSTSSTPAAAYAACASSLLSHSSGSASKRRSRRELSASPAITSMSQSAGFSAPGIWKPRVPKYSWAPSTVPWYTVLPPLPSRMMRSNSLKRLARGWWMTMAQVMPIWAIRFSE
mmetsp:Transcript_30738/g.78326  ORF Transcript_30738/g.78326 Transcript_30738/m.78326 type:complete len:320 (+) Transcript_30738:150-1109(+)